LGAVSNFHLKEKLRKTDWLIDQIVYKLYGLTEEEIKIVEEQGIMGT
jgi:type II restriction/modification system DNA methylase subunit YeeA